MNAMLLVLLTAVTTSGCTVLLGWLLFRHYAQARLNAAVDAKAEEIGVELRERVSEGVQDGIRTALIDLPTHAARSASQSGRDLVADTMKFWLGERRER